MGVEEHGRWLSDTVFQFNEPRELAPGLSIKTIDVSMLMTSDPDATPEMVIEALIDSNAMVEEAKPEEMVKARCPDCGRRGVIPAEVIRDRWPAPPRRTQQPIRQVVTDPEEVRRRNEAAQRNEAARADFPEGMVILRCPPCWDKRRN